MIGRIELRWGRLMMRCVDVIEELAAPHGPESAALTEHLAGCPRCAAWARQSARLDQLWEMTRPEEPSPATWSAVWSQATQSLDAVPSSRLLPFAASRPHPWRRRAMLAFGIAQAAALLVGAWLVTRTDPGRPPVQNGLALNPASIKPGVTAPVPTPTRAANVVTVTTTKGAEIDIDYGAQVMIHSGPEGVTVVSRATYEGSGAVATLQSGPVDRNFEMFNIIEAMAE
jgi:hypothetical protein